MSETRSAIPYISHLRLTKRPTRRWQPTGYTNRDGQDLHQQVTDLPGIEVEITPYMGTVKGPAQQFRFPLKAFFEDALAAHQEIEKPTAEQLKVIENLQATINRADITWAESILLAGELPTLDSLWADVFSYALDEFPSWAESSSAGGIPVELKEMQWDARFPADGPKSIDLNVGVFNGDMDPTVYSLSFEDQGTREQRLAYDAQIQSEIDRLTDAVANASGTEKVELESQLAARKNEQEQRAKIERGLMSSLFAKPSVSESLPVLLMSILGALKKTKWPNLDMALVQQRMAAALAGLK
jgi:hypothetical protein